MPLVPPCLRAFLPSRDLNRAGGGRRFTDRWCGETCLPFVPLCLRAFVPLLVALALAACSDVEKAKRGPEPARAERSFDLDVPRILSGTISSQAVMLGRQPVVVRGYGLVVGLNGTGSRDIPPGVRAHMLAEMARRGIGQASEGFGHINPEQMLNSADTAVVIVEAVIPPGAVGRQVVRRNVIEGTHFDVRVFADPRTGTTSLEGGRLYTAELRPALPGEFVPRTGSRQASALAEAKGPIFVNPFADPGELQAGKASIGRILHGGEVLKDMPLKLRLATPTHARAEYIQNAINSRFPQEPGQRELTGHGESDETIAITVPPSFRSNPEQFVELLMHMTIQQSRTEAIASSIKRILLNDPGYAYQAAWRWQALGVRAMPIIRDLYDYPEEQPRLAALRAGAMLDDPLVIPHLTDMTRSASADARRQAVELLGQTGFDPRADEALRAMQNDDDVDVRLAAYEALTKRADPFIERYDVEGKFVLDLVESDKPLIYITQIGQPRIAIFGKDLAIDRPVYVHAWQGRFMMKADEDDEEVEVFYRPERGQRVIEMVDPQLDKFVQFLARESTIEDPRPGLNLSYRETVGALYEIKQQDYLHVDFKAEQDRIAAAILRAQNDMGPMERPEFGDPDFDFLQPEEGEAAPATGELPGEELPGETTPPPAVGMRP